MAVESDIEQLKIDLANPEFEFQMVDQAKRKSQLNEILNWDMYVRN